MFFFWTYIVEIPLPAIRYGLNMWNHFLKQYHYLYAIINISRDDTLIVSKHCVDYLKAFCFYVNSWLLCIKKVI